MNKEINEFLEVLWAESKFVFLSESFEEFKHSAKEYRDFKFLVEELLQKVKINRNLAIKACNYSLSEYEQEQDSENENRIFAIGSLLGVFFNVEGDPRGFTVKLQTPKTKKGNTWGGAEVGWGVPGS